MLACAAELLELQLSSFGTVHATKVTGDLPDILSINRGSSC